MIFVTTGSQKFQFNRLLQKVDLLIEEGKIREPVFAQVGCSDYRPRHMEYSAFLDREEFQRRLDACDIVITHGGTGVIIRAVKEGKKVIAVPRREKYGEHVDDHQVQLLKQFEEMNLISSCYEIEDLGKCYLETLEKTFRTYTSNTAAVIEDIEDYLDAARSSGGTQKAQEGRIQYLDVAKGIAILLVCIGHAITNNENVHMVTMPHLLRFISQFHMPLFFLINGMLFRDQYIAHPVRASIHKFKAYYVPFVVYNLIFLVLHNLFAELGLVNEYHHGGSYTPEQFIHRFLMIITGHRQSFGGAMWFLGSLLIISLLFIWSKYLIGKWMPLKRQEACMAVVVLVFVLAGISGRCPEAFKLNVSLYSMAFFYVGYLYRKYDMNRYLLKNKTVVFTAMLLFNVAVAYVSPVGVAGKDYRNFWLFALCAVTGSIMVLMSAQMRWGRGFAVLVFIGKKSLDIMSLHFLAFKAVSVLIIAIYGFSWDRLAEYPVLAGTGGGWWMVYTAAGCGLSAAARSLYDLAGSFLAGKREKQGYDRAGKGGWKNAA